MFRIARTADPALVFLAFASLLTAGEADRDFSGNWVLDVRGSNAQSEETSLGSSLNCRQDASLLRCSATRSGGASIEWTYDLNGADTRYRFGDESRNSKVKWEGDALLINTIVSGPHDYSILDRWTLSHDRSLLTISRQTMQNGAENETTLAYRREGTLASQPPPAAYTNNPSPKVGPPTLRQPPAPASSTELVVHAGTRIPLSLRNEINTKHSHEGDRVYLDTLYPVVVENRIIIPRNSYVIGTLTTSKPAGAIGKKGELFIRFDSLTLPNGTTRDFRSRLASADAAQGKVDPKEGTITGERDKANTAKTTAETTGIGAGIGGLAGAAAGHPLTGVGIGAAAGAAVGLATMLNKHKPDVVLKRGTVIEMLLDRDLLYQPSELTR